MQTTLWTGLRRFALAASLVPTLSGVALGASHREAPLISLDPAADITDVYAFVSYDADNLARSAADRKVTLIMNVIPGEEPSSGPNYYSFDDGVLYAFHVDNDRDGVDDVTYEVRFATDTPGAGNFIANANLMAPPPITALEGPGSGSLGRKQRYTVTELRDCRKGDKGCKKKTTLFSGQLLSAVPSNIGPFTMPDYAALAAQGIYTDASAGARVFAGQRAETFAIDLGAVFDTINLRRNLPILTLAEDANDNMNPFGFNAFSGFNVNTIALELPISRLTSDRMPVGDANKLIGVYAATSRTKKQIHVGEPKEVDFKDDTLINTGDFRQVARLGNPLVNELIIPLGKKDMWNASAPEDEAQFAADYRRLDVAKALQFVSNVPVPTGPRDDIVTLLLTYPGSVVQGEALGPAAPRHERAADSARTDQAPGPARARRGREPDA